MIASAGKAIAYFPGWSKPDDEDHYSYFQAPLSIGGVTEAGLFLAGGAMIDAPDKNVSFEIVLLTHGGAKRTKIMRLDWRSLRGGHTNQRRYNCPDGCPGRTGETHFHSFQVNWMEHEQKLRGSRLPCAVNISENLQSYEQLRTYVGKHFQINNIDIVSPPEWEYKLRV
jgi:hypothetical protein